MILALAQRGAVIGAAFDAWMLHPGWIRGQTTPETAGVTLRTLMDHMDHICQLTGSARHVGIGSDLDGCFGTEQSPADLNSIADLNKLPALLSERGFTPADIRGVMGGNFLGVLGSALK